MRLDLGLGKRPADSRIVVAMSGGVDSSVTAALLAEAGYEVVGITLQLYDHGAAVGRKGACCAGRDIHDARAVADRLGIPHYVLDFEARFKAAVIDDFAAAYAEGRTPIPCVRCNERVKFRDLLAVARDLGADALATGHYVRREEGPDGPELHRAAKPNVRPARCCSNCSHHPDTRHDLRPKVGAFFGAHCMSRRGPRLVEPAAIFHFLSRGRYSGV